jgi:uracil-DNA glycosylase family 4
MPTLVTLNRRITACRRCPRLIEHCQAVAATRRAAYRDQSYHGKPVPNFGDPDARLLIVGLAPGAHGANRTGRMFTGDRSGDFLYARLHETGFANQPHATDAADGLTLHGALITAACHCAPPGNKPTPGELAACESWLDETFDLLTQLRVVVCLGRIALDSVLKLYQRRGWIASRAAYPFSHGCEHRIDGAPTVLCCFHPSQQNTFTGRLTPKMMREVFAHARRLIA